ncbi:helix-turn-helix domain-containing protein [Leucobacter sp. GX24907]
MSQTPPAAPVPAPNFEALRARLNQLRADRGLTLDELSERAGISRRTLVGVSGGQVTGSLETWLRLAVALEVTYDALLQTALPNPAE